MALLWSAIAAGLSISASLVAKGIFHVHLGALPGGYLLENLGYTFGFIIVILARQQLFTENTVTAVLPIMHKPSAGNIALLLRLWGVVLLGNLLGGAIAAWAFNIMPIFDDATREAFQSISQKVMENTPTEMFANAIISGWLVATMVWMFPAAGSAKVIVIILMTADCAGGHHAYRRRQCGNFLSDFQRSPALAGVHLALRAADARRQHLRRHLYLRPAKPRPDSQRHDPEQKAKAKAEADKKG